jgi:hypothetical protein
MSDSIVNTILQRAVRFAVQTGREPTELNVTAREYDELRTELRTAARACMVLPTKQNSDQRPLFLGIRLNVMHNESWKWLNQAASLEPFGNQLDDACS